ncbi:hypothetical protein G6O69_20755 [Pseudenhygromyxa sp. WMMC2535]|uniref:hypothetical protein n=1 Tax=Pseudenhygromyxa sp. WMMC2535 TaxID=2712867 RepID=UPI001595D10C|nr:hypothetical protein [Pseudenhygromyxa sp. WMMC2535]NVB40285.1 hypothetical protein [Pseudenhygromyxa sp. WMMC2535]
MKSIRRAVHLLGVFALALSASPSPARSHPGGLDGCGCHSGSRPEHCHRNPCNYCPSSYNCPGKIKVTTLPKAEVWIDGEYAGDPGKQPTIEPLQGE